MFFIWNSIAMFCPGIDMRLFVSHKKKTILFTRDMVHKIFNVPSGPRAVELLKRNERCELRDIYRQGSRAPMKKSIAVLKGAADDDAVTLERTWVLLCIALVLVPGTGNMVSLDYLASLKDLDELREFAWDEHVLATALREVRKYQLKREAGASGFWIGGCLPMFPVCQTQIIFYLFHLVDFFCFILLYLFCSQQSYIRYNLSDLFFSKKYM